jgi:segregation and condensation protein B
MTRAKFAPWLRRLHSAPVENRLSAPAMETLAVVAYRQPVLRADIEAIRGVQSGEVLRQLIERDLVRIVGRSDELGRPFLYGTTKQFLQVFGLRHLDELPKAGELRNRRSPTMTEPVVNDIHTDQQNTFPQIPVAEEETNVKSLSSLHPRQNDLDEESCVSVMRPRHGDRLGRDDYPVAVDEEDDFDEDDEDEEDEDEDLDDEPWEEVDDEDDDFDDEDDDWDDDEDFDDEDEDWDDDEDDDDWDDDEEEEEEEEEK